VLSEDKAKKILADYVYSLIAKGLKSGGQVSTRLGAKIKGFIVPMLQRGNASSDAPASQNAERSSMNSHGDRGNYKE